MLQKKLDARSTKMYVEAHNAAADAANKKIENEGYKLDDKKTEKLYNRVFTQTWNKSLADFYDNDEDALRAQEMVKKYDMTSFDELARNNTAAIESVRKAVEEAQ